MSADTSHDLFCAQWLALRETLDAESRSHRLTGLAADWLASRRGPHGIVDLGSGSGSNLRFLAPRLPGPQRWRLVDHDARLLAHIRRRGARLRDSAGGAVALQTQCRGLAPVDPELLAEADLVVASALFDLMSAAWVTALAGACAARGQALLLTLSVDGDWAFLDRQGARVDARDDMAVRALFQAHQRRDKGLGPALGGEAPERLVDALAAAGFEVESAATPWVLAAGSAAHQALLESLVTGWHAAAVEQAPDEASWLNAWRERRRHAIADGQLGVTVGHRDIFARPAVARP